MTAHTDSAHVKRKVRTHLFYFIIHLASYAQVVTRPRAFTGAQIPRPDLACTTSAHPIRGPPANETKVKVRLLSETGQRAVRRGRRGISCDRASSSIRHDREAVRVLSIGTAMGGGLRLGPGPTLMHVFWGVIRCIGYAILTLWCSFVHSHG